MPDSALIGHTGTVGGNLMREGRFDAYYNSQNIESIQNKQFQSIVCAAAPGFKWLANQHPDEDWAAIRKLMQCLETVSATSFVLVSTIDVYGQYDLGVDEDFGVFGQPNDAYGKHRQELERFVRSIFPGALIVRLAGIFGEGLKKNVIFDLMHDNYLERLNEQSEFQWYHLAKLQSDIQVALKHGLQVVNLFPEPIATREIVDAFFTERRSQFGLQQALPTVRYDLRTKHSRLFGSDVDGYRCSREQVLRDLRTFLQTKS